MRSAEQRAVVVADGTHWRALAHEQEAGRAQLFVGTFGLNSIGSFTALLRAFLFVLVLVVGRDHSILEDRVQVGFDVVGATAFQLLCCARAAASNELTKQP